MSQYHKGCRSQESSVSIEAKLQAGWLTNLGSILGRGKRFFCPLQHPDQLWCPPDLLSNAYQGAVPTAVKRPGPQADHSPPSSAELFTALHWAQRQLYLQLYCALKFIIKISCSCKSCLNVTLWPKLALCKSPLFLVCCSVHLDPVMLEGWESCGIVDSPWHSERSGILSIMIYHGQHIHHIHFCGGKVSSAHGV
jgi:hypothetical protein